MNPYRDSFTYTISSVLMRFDGLFTISGFPSFEPWSYYKDNQESERCTCLSGIGALPWMKNAAMAAAKPEYKRPGDPLGIS